MVIRIKGIGGNSKYAILVIKKAKNGCDKYLHSNQSGKE
jgi:hypothetical protein